MNSEIEIRLTKEELKEIYDLLTVEFYRLRQNPRTQKAFGLICNLREKIEKLGKKIE
jgi:hypothetical protein